MKKLLLILLSCFMVIGLFGCGNNDEENDGTPTETVSDTAAPEDNGDEGNDGGDETVGDITVKINSASADVVIFGERETYSENFLNCNYPGSGFEMKIKTAGGNVSVRIQTSDTCCFRVWVDGTAQKSSDGSEYFSIIGNKLIELTGLSDGEHTLRVVRISDGDVTAKIYAATFKGEQLALDNSDRYFIEFIGDENALGDMLGDGRDDISLAYSYLTADKVGADYAITAYAGAGLGDGVTSNVLSLYGSTGNFTRRADMAVVSIGAADVAAETDTASFKAKYTELLTSLKKTNGAYCKIVCVVTFDNAEYEQAIADVCEELGGETYGYYCCASDIKTNGKLTAEQHTALSEALGTYILGIKDAAVEKRSLNAETSGAGMNVTHKSEEWTKIG